MVSFYSEKHFQMSNVRCLLVSFISNLKKKEALRMRLMFPINKRNKSLIINLIFKTWHQINNNKQSCFIIIRLGISLCWMVYLRRQKNQYTGSWNTYNYEVNFKSAQTVKNTHFYIRTQLRRTYHYLKHVISYLRTY